MIHTRYFAIAAALACALTSPRPAVGGDGALAYIEGLVRALEADRGQAQPINVAEAVLAAIANNPGIVASRGTPAATREAVAEAASVYEPLIRVDLAHGDRKVPTTNFLLDGGVSVREDDEYAADFGISKLLRTGTAVEVFWTNERRTTNSGNEFASPRYDPTLGVAIEQPLLRDFGGYGARTTVSLARNASGQAAADYEAELALFVEEVINAYWAYTLEEAELEAARRSHQLASELAEQAAKRVKVGTLPPVAAREARADAAAREEELIAAERELDLAARTLQYTIMADAGRTGTPAAVKPSERHMVKAVDTDRGHSLRTAVERRGEIRAARLAVASARLSERREHNQLLPNLDLVGQYQVVGLGGKRNPLATQLPPPGALADDEEEAYADALDQMTSGDFFNYRVELQLEVPLFNAAAKSRHTQATIELRRSEDLLREVVADVALEIEAAAGDVEAARKRVAAASLSRELADENLRNQQRRYEVGIVTTTDVLDFQEKATTAMAAQARAITDHANAITALRRAEGTLLDAYGVTVEYRDKPGVPWWARF